MASVKEYIALQGQANAHTWSNAITEALSKGATKVLCDKSKAYVVYQRPSIETDEPQSEASEVYRFIRQGEIIDLSENLNNIPQEEIMRMYLALNDNGLIPAYLLLRSKSFLRKALDISPTRPLSILFGAKIIENGEVEEDTLLLAGTATRAFEPADIVLTIRGVL